MLPDEAPRSISQDGAADLHRSRNSYPPRSSRRHYGDTEKGGRPATPDLQNGSKIVTLEDSPFAAEASATTGATWGHEQSPRAAWPWSPRPGRSLGPEALPSLGAASFDHESSAARSHADEEAMSPSSAAIVRLERSLHCFWDPLRKVEPVMLSGIASVVKTRLVGAAGRAGGRVMVNTSSGGNSLPDTEPDFKALWLIR